VTWAHPEFGQVLTSCSFDRTAAVWEEIVGESNDKQRGQSHWVCYLQPFKFRFKCLLSGFCVLWFNTNVLV